MDPTNTITMTMPTGALTLLVTAICANFNYPQNGGDLSEQDFAIEQLVAWGEGQVVQYNNAQAAAAAATAQAAALAAATPPSREGLSVSVQ